MFLNHVPDKVIPAIASLPEHTELAIAVMHDNDVDYYGFIKEENTVSNKDNRLAAFEIGSVTKAFTGYVLTQLAHEEKIGLDDPIQRYLPFPILNAPPITLRHLAMHTSGVQRVPHDLEEQPDYDKDNPFVNYTEKHLVNYLTHHLHLDSLPGEKFQYSNLGSGLLSYIISKIEGIPFAEVVEERIFKPFNMQHSSFNIREVHTAIVRGIDDKGNFCTHWDGGILDGCLGIISTLEDMVSFTRAIYDPSNAVANLQAQETFTVDENVKANLGWNERLILPEDVRMQGINGGTGGYGASVLLNRQQRCAVGILSNIWPWHYMDVMYPVGKALLVELSKSVAVVR